LDEKEDYYLVNALGRILRKLTLSDDSPFVDLSAEPVGVYCLVSISDPKKQVKLVKN